MTLEHIFECPVRCEVEIFGHRHPPRQLVLLILCHAPEEFPLFHKPPAVGVALEVLTLLIIRTFRNNDINVFLSISRAILCHGGHVLRILHSQNGLMVNIQIRRPSPDHTRKISILNVKNEKKHIQIIKNRKIFGRYPLFPDHLLTRLSLP